MEEKKPNRRRGRKQTGSRDEGFDMWTQSRSSWANMAEGVVLQLGMLWQRFGFGVQWASAGPRGGCSNPAGSTLPTGPWECFSLMLLISWTTEVNKLPLHRSFTRSMTWRGLFSQNDARRQIITCLSLFVAQHMYLQTLTSLSWLAGT